MYRYLAAFMLAFTLTFGLVGAAHAGSEGDASTETFSWSAVFSSALFGTLVAAPVVVYFALNDRKDK